jgi:hypothetical protein
MLSYCKGSEVPLRSETIYQAFASAARTFPDRIALISRPDAVRWTCRQLLDGLVLVTVNPASGIAHKNGPL